MEALDAAEVAGEVPEHRRRTQTPIEAPEAVRQMDQIFQDARVDTVEAAGRQLPRL